MKIKEINPKNIYDSLMIIPDKKQHDSGYKFINLYGLRLNKKKIGIRFNHRLITKYCDVITFNFVKNKEVSFSIDTCFQNAIDITPNWCYQKFYVILGHRDIPPEIRLIKMTKRFLKRFPQFDDIHLTEEEKAIREKRGGVLS